MAYCTVADVQAVLPEKIAIGDRNIGTPSPGRPVTQRSNLTPAQAEQYIQYATQYVDSKLRNFYSCPLRRVKTYETNIEDNVSSGTNVIVRVRDSGAFMRATKMRLQDANHYEESTIKEVVNLTTVKLESLNTSFSVFDTKVSVLEYPDPIPIVTARMACAILLDRLFSAEQAPDVSTYGKTQRTLASLSIDDIMKGAILLFGQEHTGRRFVRGSLFDAYKSPAETQKGEEKEA